MGDFTYNAPEPKAFLHTLRTYLESAGHSNIAEILLKASVSISKSDSYSALRWNAYSASVIISVPVGNLPKFTETIRQILTDATKIIMPQEVGFDVDLCQISPILEMPPEEDDPLTNNTTIGNVATINHDGLRFRSKSEIKIYDELKKQNILFFANATAVLGGLNKKLEPDFLICLEGRWGILEVMGDIYHPASTAMKDHERGRRFKTYGLLFIEFYDASECYNSPEKVVSAFLKQLGSL